MDSEKNLCSCVVHSFTIGNNQCDWEGRYKGREMQLIHNHYLNTWTLDLYCVKVFSAKTKLKTFFLGDISNPSNKYVDLLPKIYRDNFYLARHFYLSMNIPLPAFYRLR